jgi:hypothetical protein
MKVSFRTTPINFFCQYFLVTVFFNYGSQPLFLQRNHARSKMQNEDNDRLVHQIEKQ